MKSNKNFNNLFVVTNNMNKDMKFLTASLIFFAISILSLISVEIINYHPLWFWVFGITYFIFIFLFMSFLAINHGKMKSNYSKNKALRHYILAIIICFIFLSIGIFGTIIGLKFDNNVIMTFTNGFIGTSLFALAYCILGWNDIRRKK